MFTFNYHFIENEKFDLYGMIGAGYKNRNWDFTSNDLSYDGFTGSSTFIPLAFRIGIGARYYFIPNLGVNLNFGGGQGSIVNGGLSFKI